MLSLRAPAKINLTLEVLGKRQDGFHEIRSVIQPVDLCDTLRFQLSREVEIRSHLPGWLARESLVATAVNLVQETTGCSRGVTIEVTKRIPLLSGLGGDSSDAAVTLRGLDKLWGLGLSFADLVDLASRLGSDVAFFLYGGTALVAGRGEMVTPLLPLPPHRVVLLVPPVVRTAGKTARLYASLSPEHYSTGRITDSLVAQLKKGGITPASLFNVFDAVAALSFDRIEEYRQAFLDSGADHVHLAGSGPALFSLLEDKARAEKIYRGLQRRGLESYLVTTLPAIDRPD